MHYATTLLHDTTLRYTTALLHSYTPLHFHTYPLLQKDKLIVRIDKLQYCKARRIPQGVYCDTRPFLSEKRARPKNGRPKNGFILPSALALEEGAEEAAEEAAAEVVEPELGVDQEEQELGVDQLVRGPCPSQKCNPSSPLLEPKCYYRTERHVRSRFEKFIYVTTTLHNVTKIAAFCTFFAFCPLGVVHYATTLLHDTTLRHATLH